MHDRGRLVVGIARVDVGAGWCQLVDPIEDLVGERDLGCVELVLELRHRAGPDDRGGHRGVLEHEREREIDEADPGVAGQLRQLLDEVQLALVRRALGRVQRIRAREAGQPRVGGDLGVAAVLAGEPPAVERAPRDHSHAVALTAREDRVLDRAGKDRIRRLLADEALGRPPGRRPLRFHDRLGGIRRRPDAAHLALVDEVVERAERLVDVGAGVGPVHLVEVDVVSAETAQAVVACLHDPAS